MLGDCALNLWGLMLSLIKQCQNSVELSVTQLVFGELLEVWET